jgi:5-methylcytosine-specific restriction endonuclease McrA
MLRGLSAHRAAGRVKACGECGSEFCPLYGSSGAEFCGPCSEARALATQKAAKALRRAMSRGANGGERFDPVEVLERDKWRCQLCGRKTPKANRGSYDDDAPELDHIVPVAAGGKHTRANTQCACRACNSAKGARTLGRLNLALA